ncbi:SHOCT domain-containing protein [Paraglaciecola sp. L3A3]|uniref:SHOCT domain-containing protein n=1 Tax=Paraglaciecola sp. L3A3 TaxID=2686358 RepID=UPI00131C82DB|nr:SHOCT domain-containing protein [Paraglaciecola sp. L3A3]
MKKYLHCINALAAKKFMDNLAEQNRWKRYFKATFLTVFISTLFFSKIVSAKQYQLQLLTNFNELNKEQDDLVWLEPILSPAKDEQIFVANDQGYIYLLDKSNSNKQKLALNINTSTNKSAAIRLSSITLHPSFIRPEELGYATLYTAHNAKLIQPKQHAVSLPDNIETVFYYETVITAWQYDFDKQEIDIHSAREILSIPIKSLDEGINRLSFDPYQKSWGRDYGQLYFSLNASYELKHYPLYSGSILRIHPQDFGDSHYTIPSDNPFIKDTKINDEIVVTGLDKIEQYFWVKNKQGEIFVQHHNNEQYWLSKLQLGDNYLADSAQNHLKQQDDVMPTILLYQGRQFLTLKNHFIFLSSYDGKWLLNYSSINNNEPALSAEILTTNNLLTPAFVDLEQDENSHIFIFDMKNASLYILQEPQEKLLDPAIPSQVESDTGTRNYLLYIILVAVLLFVVLIYGKSRNNKNGVNKLEKNLFRLKYESSSNKIFLYLSEQREPIKSIDLTAITGCEVLLNHQVIAMVNGQAEHIFSNAIEQDLRELFAEEHFEKMLDCKTRTIELILTTKKEKVTACLYFRKGKRRTTGAKYPDVIDIIMDFCWQLSRQINPNNTEERSVTLSEKIYQTPRYIVTPTKPQFSRHNSQDKISVDPNISPLAQDKPTDKDDITAEIISTEVVDALEKLANLHQQGLLTDEEFTVAKSKLLQ